MRRGNTHETLTGGLPETLSENSPVYSGVRPRGNASRAYFFVYFNQEGKLVAKEYFDNEWKVSHGIFEGGNINKLFKKSEPSPWTRGDSRASSHLER